MLREPTLILVGAIVLIAFIAWVALTGVIERGAALREIPDPRVTPGAVASTDVAEVCAHPEVPGYYARQHRHTSEDMKRAVARAYRLPNSRWNEVEFDHLVPLCLGGADSIANIWPQTREGTWNAERKDQVEAAACRAVCRGGLTLDIAQKWFLAPADWRETYRRLH